MDTEVEDATFDLKIIRYYALYINNNNNNNNSNDFFKIYAYIVYIIKMFLNVCIIYY